jgi:hypothetical protein
VGETGGTRLAWFFSVFLVEKELLEGKGPSESLGSEAES